MESQLLEKQEIILEKNGNSQYDKAKILIL